MGANFFKVQATVAAHGRNLFSRRQVCLNATAMLPRYVGFFLNMRISWRIGHMST